MRVKWFYLSALVACAGGGAPETSPTVVVLPPQPPQPTAITVGSVAPPASNAPAADVPFKCETQRRFEIGNRSYCAYTEPESWDDAERTCVTNGGHLMSLDTRVTSDAVKKAIASPVGVPRAAWIGLELAKAKPKNEWRWVNGEAVKSPSWAAGEPNNFEGNESCGEWLVADGKWNDTRCDLRLPSVCQAPTGKSMACAGNGKPLTVGGRDSYCVNLTLRSFADAKKACIADGGSLAVLRTKEENDALRDAMAARVPGERMWIGLGDAADEGVWKWTSGAPLTYEAWRSGEPNDFQDEDCVELYLDGWTWNDFDCSAAKPFLCESPPKRK